MFCTKCGAQIQENEKFCPRCGNLVKHHDAESAVTKAARDAQYDPDAPLVINITQDKVDEMMRRSSQSANNATSNSKKSRNNQGAVWVLAALGVLLVLLVGVGILSNHYNATTPSEIVNAISGQLGNDADNEHGTAASESDAAVEANASEPAASTEATTTTTATTTTATTTTVTTTTTTTATTTVRTSSQQEMLAKQAREIAQLLVNNKWKTTVSGYDAVITFKSDGTALIEVDVKVGFFTVTQKVNATYSLSSECFAVIKGEYNGMNLGISGTITKISNTELLLDRGCDLGTITLKAAK